MSSYLSRYIGADRLPTNLSNFDIDVYFRLPTDTVAALKERFRTDRLPGVENRLVGMATQIVFLRTTGKPLDNVARLPPALLKHLGATLGVQPPTIATLRSIYQRRQTAYEHQVWARRHLGLGEATKAKLAELKKVLLVQSGDAVSVDELVTTAAHWLYDQRIIIPADRTLRDIARDAFADVEQASIRVIRSALTSKQQALCRRELFSKRSKIGITNLEWLKTPPKRHSPTTLDETLEKIRYLKELEVHTWNLEAISLARQQAYAQAIASRPPSDSKKRKDDTQLLEVICFLRVTLLELTDSVLYQTGRRIADFTRQASGKTQARQALKSTSYRESLISIKDLLTDHSISAEERLAAIEAVVNALGDLAPNSHAAQVRETLIAEPSRVHSLLTAVSGLEFKGAPKQMALQQFDALRQLHTEGSSRLPPDFAVPVRKIWRNAIDGEDRKRAFKALEASTALELRRGLRRGAVWVDHSLSFREREQMLIPREEWERDRDRYLSMLGLPADADEYLTKLLALIKAGLAAMAEAQKAGVVSVDADGLLHLEALAALPEDVEPKQLRDHIFQKIGSVQFPDLILEVDALTNFSEILLGRRANDEHELVALYAALIAHGTEIDAKAVAAMIPQLDPAHVATAMRALESDARMTRAIRRIVEFQTQHSIASLWGTGALGSSDMMSLDASRHLWNARVDPRRRTYAVGVYTHVLDHHGVVYHQPVVLNERQAGPAIHGVVAYNQHAGERRLARLAVDTHGYTHLGMAIAKLLGFDLCPRLRDLSERKLYLPRDIDTPDGLERVVVKDVSLRAIRKHWDELMRLVASIASGRVSAALLLQRLGSAAQGDPLHRAAEQLGMLLRTVFLCDYFSNSAFRRELHTVLNRGESVHQLQRTVYTGKIAPERGRRRDELIAISGAHTLLTNLVIAWNTHHMQEVVDKLRKAGQDVDDRWLARMGPAHFSHINFRGLFRFGIERYRESLLNPQRSSVRNLGARR